MPLPLRPRCPFNSIYTYNIILVVVMKTFLTQYNWVVGAEISMPTIGHFAHFFATIVIGPGAKGASYSFFRFPPPPKVWSVRGSCLCNSFSGGSFNRPWHVIAACCCCVDLFLGRQYPLVWWNCCCGCCGWCIFWRIFCCGCCIFWRIFWCGWCGWCGLFFIVGELEYHV